MKKAILFLNLILTTYFLCWYFIWDGYLGYGYGELLYILFIVLYWVISILLILINKRLNNYFWILFTTMLMFYIWLAYLLWGDFR